MITSSMTVKERKTIAEKIFSSLEDVMSELYYRWQEEKDFEDINDYGEVIASEVSKFGGKLIKMTKRPFGFHYRLGDAIYSISYSRDEYSYWLIMLVSK